MVRTAYAFDIFKAIELLKDKALLFLITAALFIGITLPRIL